MGNTSERKCTASHEAKNFKWRVRAHTEIQGLEADSLTYVQQKQLPEHAAAVKSHEVICNKLIK